MIKLITGYILPDWEEYMENIISKYNKLGVQIDDIFYNISKQYVEYTFQSIENSYLKEKQTTLLHLPEYNLHPSCQSKLIKEFLDWSVTNEVDLHIFTHSDHIVNSLICCVKLKKIGPTNIKIDFYNEQNECIDVPVLENGRIINAPEGFFDQIDKDMKTLMGF